MARRKLKLNDKHECHRDKDITVLRDFFKEQDFNIDPEDNKLYALMEGLSPAEITFCYEYAQNGFNATDALRTTEQLNPKYRRHNDTKCTGDYMLKSVPVARLIYYLTTTKVKKYVVTPEKVLKELALIAFSDITKFIEIDEMQKKITLKDFGELGILTRGIKKIKIKTGWKKAPDGTFNEVTESELELHDKLKALETLSKNMGLLNFNEESTLSAQDIREGFGKIAEAVKSADFVDL